jgi:uncharacterized RDD family membrane protein YckC
MADNWYYAVGTQQQGPVGIDRLKEMAQSGELARETLVWREGLAQWSPAHAVTEIAASFPAATGAAPLPQPLPYGGYSGANLNYYNPTGAAVVYAGFWLRFVAFIIDYVVCAIPNFIINQIVSAALGQRPVTVTPGTAPNLSQISMLASVGIGAASLSIVINWLYYALMETSVKQATLGKMALGLLVTDLNGNRLSFGRATGRYFGKIVSYFTVYIGFMMAGWTQRKQALHDMMAGTLVVRKQLPTYTA